MQDKMQEHKWRRGDINPETGLVFRGYNKLCTNGENWITKEKLEQTRAQQRQHKREWRKLNPDKSRNAVKAYRLANLEKVSTRERNQKRASKDKVNERMRIWYSKNSKRIQQKRRLKHLSNPEIKRAYYKRRKATNPVFALRVVVGNRLLGAIKNSGWTKRSKTGKAIGCTWNELKIYIQARFQPGMTWQNRGKWHIDHVIPLSSAKTEREMLKLCHYTNLQPLWALDNIRKSDNMPQQMELALP